MLELSQKRIFLELGVIKHSLVEVEELYPVVGQFRLVLFMDLAHKVLEALVLSKMVLKFILLHISRVDSQLEV